jgi:transposase
VYAISLSKRWLVEKPFGWLKQIGPLKKVKLRGLVSEGGLVIRVQLRGLQPDPHSQTAGAECMKQLTCTRCHLVIGADRKLKQQDSV